MPLPVCDVCGKKMPPHILSIHMQKTHPQAPKEHLTSQILDGIKTTKFDYDTPYWCQQCQVDIPDILKDYHMHVRHGL